LQRPGEEIRLRYLTLATTALVLVGPRPAAAQQPADSGSIVISVTAPDSVVQRAIGRGLFLRIEQVPHARVDHFGWWVRVTRGDHPQPGKTLILPPMPPHGPHPSDVFAWTAREQYYPDERHFDVLNQPLEIVARLHDYETAADSTATWFTRGQLDVTWIWHAAPARPNGRKP
jgi:hypothetical protein